MRDGTFYYQASKRIKGKPIKAGANIPSATRSHQSSVACRGVMDDGGRPPAANRNGLRRDRRTDTGSPAERPAVSRSGATR